MTLCRRTFVCGSVTCGAALATGLPQTGCAPVQPAPLAKAQVILDASSTYYGAIPIEVARYPDLNRLGGAITIQIDRASITDLALTLPRGGVLLVQRGPQDFVALESSCPHSGCPLGYSPSKEEVMCPCHGSSFAISTDNGHEPGDVLHLPARDNLTTWDVKLVDGTVYVQLTMPNDGDRLPPVMGGTMTVPIASFPKLAAPGGSLLGRPGGSGPMLILVRTDQDNVVCLSAICTHAACRVEATSLTNLDCPCHGSQYAFDGSVITGPATQPLKSFPTTFDGTNAVVTIA
jgi:Rieske Fe-S protein